MQVDVESALNFLRAHHRAVLATTRADGRPQLSPIAANVDADGLVAWRWVASLGFQFPTVEDIRGAVADVKAAAA